MKNALELLSAALLVMLTQLTWAQLPQLATVGFENNTGGLAGTSTFKAWVPSPAEVPDLKAILFITARSPVCTYIASQDTAIRNGAIRHGYAIVLADGPIIIDWKPNQHWADSLVAGLNKIGQLAGRTNLGDLPIIPFGHSLGVNFSLGVTYDAADKVCASIHFKPGSLPKPSWATTVQTQAYQNVPQLVINGQHEGPDINNGAEPLFTNTVRNAILAERSANQTPIHHVIEYGGNHNTFPTRLARQMVLFIGKMIALRVPQSPGAGQVQLNSVNQSAGFLGNSTSWFEFNATSYQTQTYSSGAATSNYWLPDADYASAWVAFHTAPISVSLPTGPFCPGEAGIAVNVNADPSIQFGPTNTFRVQLSTVTANFESGTYYPYTIGSIRSNSNQNTIPVFIPDNLINPGSSNPLMPNNSSATAPNNFHYTVRVISSDPPLESASSGYFAIQTQASCPSAPLFIRLAPFATNAAQVYNGIQTCNGNDTSFNVLVLRQAAAPSLNTGNAITIELSDSSGNFNNPVIVGNKTSVLPFPSNSNQWFRDTVRITIPASLPPGLNYRLRVNSSSPAQTGSTAGMVIMHQNCLLTALDGSTADITTKRDRLHFQNPNYGSFVVGNIQQNQTELVLINELGQTIAASQVEENQVLFNDLKAGIYFIKSKGVGKGQSARVVVVK